MIPSGLDSLIQGGVSISGRCSKSILAAASHERTECMTMMRDFNKDDVSFTSTRHQQRLSHKVSGLGALGAKCR